jgi:hypothetical protein
MPRCRLPRRGMRLIELVKPGFISPALKVRHTSIGADQCCNRKTTGHVLIRPFREQDHAVSFPLILRFLIVKAIMVVDVSPSQQHLNPDLMKISSLLNHQATAMPQYARHYSKDLSQRTQHASHLGKSLKLRPMI